jgi:hypothetical protein
MRNLRGAIGTAFLLAALCGPAFGQIEARADLHRALTKCWVPPRDHVRPGMEITVRVVFTRDGELLGAPRITYESPGASDVQRLAYHTALAMALTRCTPLPFSPRFGKGMAGRAFGIRFIDDRHLEQAELTHGP